MAVSLISTGLSGDILNATQCAFNVKLDPQANVTGDNTTFPANTDDASNIGTTETYDQGGDVSGALFTAPVTGRYALYYFVTIQGVNTESYANMQFVTSNNSYLFYHSYDSYNMFAVGSANPGWIAAISGEIICDMDASDTAFISHAFYSISKVVDIVDNSFFTGHLVC